MSNRKFVRGSYILVSCGCVNQGECKGGTSKHFCCLCWIFREKDCLWIYVEVRIVKEYIERAAVIDLITRRYELPELCTHEINSIPAADVAPVRHGRWIKHEGYDECEACRAKVICGYNYCPNCGARMDKEDEHEAD